MTDLAKVWPLRSGISGCNAHGFPIVLSPGVPGWMDLDKAKEAEKHGDVQLMAGQSPGSLKTPEYQTMEAQPAEEPEPEPQSKPRVTKKAPVVPRRKGRYRRSDMTADGT